MEWRLDRELDRTECVPPLFDDEVWMTDFEYAVYRIVCWLYGLTNLDCFGRLVEDMENRSVASYEREIVRMEA